jgi:hypothetical protein
VLCPVLLKHFSEKEEATIVQRILDDLGKDNASKAAEEWGGPVTACHCG